MATNVSETIKNFHLQIPAEYHQVPLLSDLIIRFSVQVNIKAALLSKNASEGGWFELELKGNEIQVGNAIQYLQDLGLLIWTDKADSGWSLSPTS